MELATTTAGTVGERMTPELSISPPRPWPAVGVSLSKRAFDVIVTLLLLLFFAPLMVAIALSVIATSRGPALFRQRRTGLGGQVFVIYKFRTMTVMEDAEVQAACRGDKRVTPIGAVLRRSSLDELPQLLNVLRGDMSLVGPRPHAVAHDEIYGALLPEYADRFRTRPGLTGLAQVNGHRGEMRTLESLQARVAHDNCYIAQWSLLLDVRILASTGMLIWKDEHAY
jgi:putative colanic acid biosynthesis UDP-glucose lipid carrier transferase